MKEILILLIAFPFASHAQFAKGNVFFGGALATTLQNSDNQSQVGQSSSKYNLYSLSPSVGFFLNEKIAVGSAVSYFSLTTQFLYGQGYSKSFQTSVGLNPFVKFYIPISGSFFLAVQGTANFNRGNLKNSQFNGLIETTTNTPQYSIGLNLRPYLVFFPSPKWGIEGSFASMGYTYTRNLPDAASSSSFNLGAGGQFSLGVSYFIRK